MSWCLLRILSALRHSVLWRARAQALPSAAGRAPAGKEKVAGKPDLSKGSYYFNPLADKVRPLGTWPCGGALV